MTIGELADQFLEHRTHLRVADDVRVEVDADELLGEEVEQPALRQPVDLRVEFEALEDVAHFRREGLDVSAQVLGDVVLVADQGFQVERRGVVEVLPRDAQQEGRRVEASLLAHFLFEQDTELGRFENTVEAAQDGEGEDDLAVLGLLVVAAQHVGNGPDEGGKIDVAHWGRCFVTGERCAGWAAGRKREVPSGVGFWAMSGTSVASRFP